MVKIKNELMNAIKSEDYNQIQTLIRNNCGTTITISKIEELAKTLKCEPLKQALTSCKKMQELKGTKIEENELLEIALFIETKLKAHIDKKKYYLKSDKTGLSRTIEYDPKTKLTFIHLKCHNGAKKLGTGFFKTVTKSIQYDHNKPEIVAHAEQKGTAHQEVKALKKAKGISGVIQAKSITLHKEKTTGDKKVSMVFKMYKPGALNESVIRKLSFNEKLKIAHDLLTGMKGLHEKGLVHRDLKPGNVFIDKDKNHVKAVVSDLGHGCKHKEAKGKIPNATTSYSPPEAFNANLHKIDYKKSDIFSLGVILFELLFEKQPEWMKNNLVHDTLKAKDQAQKKTVKKKFVEQIKLVQDDLKKKIAEKEAKSRKALFMEVISDMLEARASKRLSADNLLQKFKVI